MQEQAQEQGVETLLRFAHLSDPHLTSLDNVAWRQLRGKRVLGYLSWWHKRRHVHQRGTLDAVTADALADAPNHIALTGDLTHIGLPHEHAEARDWLAHLNAHVGVSLSPGNHDLYAQDSIASMYANWQHFLPAETHWPRVEVRGDVHFIALCSGDPSEPLFATGHLGDRQLEGLREALRAAHDKIRVLLIHHSPHPDSHPPRKQLRDRGAMIELLAEHGAELVLHGHSHRASALLLVAGSWRIPVLGAPSASVQSDSPERAAGYHRILIERKVIERKGIERKVIEQRDIERRASERTNEHLQARIETRRWTSAGMITSQQQTLPLGRAR